MPTHRISLPSMLAAATIAVGCSGARTSAEAEERLGVTQQRFDSHETVLVDFDIDGALVADTAEPAAVRRLVEAQLMYSVGALNEDRSLGRHERLELSGITAAPRADAGSFDVTYHAKLPVAWGLPDQPTTYALTLPARVGQADQRAFALKYGKTCVDPAAGQVGEADAGRMFLVYRPHQPGCALEPGDVTTATATLSPSAENTTGRYPEYHRIWEDGELDVVAMFSRSAYSPEDYDYGARAYQEFVAGLDAYLSELQPDPAKRTLEAPSPSTVRRAATLPDGRTVRVDAAIVGIRLADEGPDLDAWYDALTPGADLIIYNGHADLGENVRTLMRKGTFVPGKYVVWAANACDTFAYVDRTLAERRAALNPDDPGGTRYMDTVSTVLGGYFWTGPPTTLTFLDAVLDARAAGAVPKTYREIFAEIDPGQGTVVTGEEDNAFQPSMFAPPAPPGASDAAPDGHGNASTAPSAEAAAGGEGGGCSAEGRRPRGAPASVAALVAAMAAALGRRRARMRHGRGADDGLCPARSARPSASQSVR